MGSSLGTENGGPAMHVAGELASAPHLPPRLPPALHTAHLPRSAGNGGGAERKQMGGLRAPRGPS